MAFSFKNNNQVDVEILGDDPKSIRDDWDEQEGLFYTLEELMNS